MIMNKKVGALPFFSLLPPLRLHNSARQTRYFEPDVSVPSIFHQIDPLVLKHTRRPISSASVSGRFGKA